MWVLIALAMLLIWLSGQNMVSALPTSVTSAAASSAPTTPATSTATATTQQPAATDTPVKIPVTDAAQVLRNELNAEAQDVAINGLAVQLVSANDGPFDLSQISPGGYTSEMEKFTDTQLNGYEAAVRKYLK